jgi:glutaredoxin 3
VNVVVYVQALCGYCAAAKALLKDKGIDFQVIDVTFKPKRRREMRERSGRATVPQIFLGGHPIGGFDELTALERQGELDKLLGLTNQD